MNPAKGIVSSVRASYDTERPSRLGRTIKLLQYLARLGQKTVFVVVVVSLCGVATKTIGWPNEAGTNRRSTGP